MMIVISGIKKPSGGVANPNTRAHEENGRAAPMKAASSVLSASGKLGRPPC